MPDNTTESAEISISDIIMRLWEGRGLVVLFPLLAVALAVLYLALSASIADRPVNYLINLKNIENQHYPNGSAFTPQDLLIPQVLSELRQRFNLPAGKNLREAISVNYDSLVAQGIAKNYREMLPARNLTQAEITAINQQYQEELRAAMRSSLRISVNQRELGVDGTVAVAMARALPDLWTEIYTTQFRIFTDTRLADISVTQDFEDLDTTASILVANTRLQTMLVGVNMILQDNRLSALEGPDGRSAAELREELRRFDSIFFGPVRIMGFLSNDAVSNAYLANLRLSIADMRRRIAAYDQALADLRDYQRGVPAPKDGDAPQPPESSSSLQVSETGVAEIVRLAQQASLSTFVQTLLRERNDIIFDISNMTKELDSATGHSDTIARAEFRDQVAQMMKDLVQRYSGLVNAARLNLSERGGQLYEPALGPFVSGSLLPASSILILGAAGLGGGLIAVMFVLLRSANRPRKGVYTT